MTKMPAALANAEDASLPTFVDDGNEFLRILRTHAKGGSNSIAAVEEVVAGFVVSPAAAGVMVFDPAAGASSYRYGRSLSCYFLGASWLVFCLLVRG